MSTLQEMLDEAGLTMFEFVVGVAVMFITALVLFLALWAFASGVSQASRDRVSFCFYATTFRHDGHLFVQAARGGILHHPDCECRKRP